MNDMRKNIVLLLACLCSVCQCFAQFGKDNQQNEFFAFGPTNLSISNDFISGRSTPIASPFSSKEPYDLSYSVSGPALFIRAFQADTSDVWHGTFVFTSGLIDNSPHANATYKIRNLQARIMQGNNIIVDWRNVTDYPFVKDTGINQNGRKGDYKTLYELVNCRLSVNDSITFDLRAKTTGEQLLTLHIKRVAVKFYPFLERLLHDSSVKTTPDFFIQHAVADHFYQSDDIYDHGDDKGIAMNNVKYYASSKLAFYFRRFQNDRDSSLVYKLTGGGYVDTSWILSGHMILMPRLQTNSNYTLLVRYKNGDNISKYTFYVPPTWFQKYQYFIIYIPSFLVIFFTTVLIARYRVKRANARRQRLALELKSIRSQLNPHFVFNALSSIQALINKNEIDNANQYLTEFSSLLRDSLQNHNADMVPLATEIKVLENYIKLEQLRFNFNYEIKRDSNIELNAVEIPSLLLQPIVENAIKHGIAVLKDAGRLVVAFSRNNDSLVISIADNGKGFDATQQQQGKFGIKLTKERIALLHETLREQPVELSLTSNEAGTVAVFTFNHWL